MYEPTAAGAWFKWSALTRPEKWLVGTAAACLWIGMSIASTLIGLFRNAYRAGYRSGSGGIEPGRDSIAGRLQVPEPYGDAAAIVAAVLIGLAIFLWMRFSRRQDELFNRVQNRAYGLGSFITFGVMALWMLLERVAGLPPLGVVEVVLAWTVCSTFVWFREARRLWP